MPSPIPSHPHPLVAMDGRPSHAQYDSRGSIDPMGDGVKDNGLTLEDLHREFLRVDADIKKFKLWACLSLTIFSMALVIFLWAFLPTIVDMTIKLISAFKRAPH
ncbi:hypothetical protein TWF192_005726 [Orbilia oligospora]|uniref:Uncharacterized protein n=1 Tax=Orbilia oligospora TaxID=2813651 RepID=A0A6G1MMM0_ORBOL|nr:hypothetical protein TWF191_003913 [Orbilia oligospora]KAF3263445.1 hypothetical protein TWF192_005726 [Orbilia oligospora]